MSVSIIQATMELRERDLPNMVLLEDDLAPPFDGFSAVREGDLDNATLAQHGFSGATETRFRDAGRIAGFMREFVSPTARLDMDGDDLIVGSVAHLFDTPDNVSHWMRHIFLEDFKRNIGATLENGQTMIEVEELDPRGFFDDAVAIKSVHDSSGQIISSTVIDFRVGRILGVTYVATVGNHTRLHEATALAIAMEKLIVTAALDA